MSAKQNRTKLYPSEILKRKQDELRNQIRSAVLLDCLTRHAEGKPLPSGHPMTASGVQAAVALLRKVLPDLSAIDQTVSGDDSRPIKITITNA